MIEEIKLSNTRIIQLGVLGAFFCFMMDLMLAVDFAHGVLYLSIIFLSLLSSDLKCAVRFGTLVTVLLIIGFFFSPPSEEILKALVNRCIILGLVWLVVSIGIQFKKGYEARLFLAAIVDSSEDAVIGKSLKGTIFSWNKGAEGIYGYTKEEMKGRQAKELFLDGEEEAQILQKLWQGKKLINYETIHKQKNGGQINVSMTVSPVKDILGNIMGISTIVRDITRLKAIEKTKEFYLDQLEKEVQKRTQELKQRNQQLTELTAHMHKVREEERSALAREVHDEMGQLLTAMKMDLSWIVKKLDGSEGKMQEKIKGLITLIEMTIKSVHRVVAQLRPSILDDLGLVAAIEWQAKEFMERMEIPCRVYTQLEDVELDRDTATAVFRIFQEALTNIARHAQASLVEITIEHNDQNLNLTIKDNGCGINKQEIEKGASFGIMGMRERAAFFSGDVVIDGETGQGTTVRLTVPWEEKFKKRGMHVKNINC